MQPVPKQDPRERIKNWDEAFLGYTIESAVIEAQRCIHCPTAPCQEACPTGNDIPNAFLLLEQGDPLGATSKFRETSNLPDMCGRLCPQESLCEGACVVGFAIRPAPYGKQPPVSIGKLEAFLADYERRNGGQPLPEPAPPTGKRVAVIGSGPAGLAVAEELTKQGHGCTVYESWPVPGGILLYGIPNFKMQKEILESKLDYLRKMGIDPTEFFPVLPYLPRSPFDGIFGMGAGQQIVLENNDPGDGVDPLLFQGGDEGPCVFQDDRLLGADLRRQRDGAGMGEEPPIPLDVDDQGVEFGLFKERQRRVAQGGRGDAVGGEVEGLGGKGDQPDLRRCLGHRLLAAVPRCPELEPTVGAVDGKAAVGIALHHLGVAGHCRPGDGGPVGGIENPPADHLTAPDRRNRAPHGHQQQDQLQNAETGQLPPLPVIPDHHLHTAVF